MTGFDETDVDLSGSTAGGTLTAVVTGGPAVYNVRVSGIADSGIVEVAVPADVASDDAGNLNSAAPAPASVEIDKTGPSVTINQAAGQGDPTSDASIEFTVVFDEVVMGFQTGDVVLSGTAGAGMAATVSGSGTTYTVSVSGMTQTGTVVAAVPFGAAVDSVSNPSNTATFTDNTVQFNLPPDSTKPTVTIDQAAAQADPTTGSPITFTVVFSESVSGFASNDVTIGGTAGATTANVSGSDASYTVTITGVTQAGTVTASIAAGAAQDAALNTSEASTSTDNTVTFIQPTIAVPTPGGTVQVTVISGGVLTAASGTAPQVPPPNGVTFPFGQLSFTATSTPGGLVVFQLTLPSPVTTYYKLVSGAWQEFTFDDETGAQVSGNTITVTIRDNGRGDSDATSGVVTDPARRLFSPRCRRRPRRHQRRRHRPRRRERCRRPAPRRRTTCSCVASLLFGVGLLLAGVRRRQSRSAKA